MRTSQLPRRLPAPRSPVLSSRELGRYSLARAIAAAADRAAGRSWQSSFETEISSSLQASDEYSGAGSGLSVPFEAFAGVDVVTGESGGYGTTPGLPAPYATALQRSIAPRLGVQIFPGLKGRNELPLTVGGATPELGVISANGDGEAAEGSLTFKQTALAPHGIGSWFRVSRAQLKNDAEVVNRVVAAEAVNAFGAIADYALFAGVGGRDEPLGLLHRSDVSCIAIGDSGGAMTRDVLKRMLAAVGAASVFDGLNFVTSNGARSAALMTPNDAGAGGGFLWGPPLGGADGSVLEAIPAWCSPAVPETLTKGSSTGLSGAVLGRWTDAAIAIWGGSAELLVDKLYASGALRCVLIVDLDAGPLHAESFARVVDIVTA